MDKPICWSSYNVASLQLQPSAKSDTVNCKWKKILKIENDGEKNEFKYEIITLKPNQKYQFSRVEIDDFVLHSETFNAQLS